MAGNSKHHGKGWPMYGKIVKRGGPTSFYAPRKRGDPSKEHTYATHPFEAVSRKPNGVLHRTLHVSEAAANRRVAGNPRHTDHRVVHHA